MELIELSCKNCGSQLKPESISTELNAARCTHCNALFAIALPQRQDSDTPRNGPRAKVPMPKGFEVSDLGHEFILKRRWFSPALFFLLFFCIFWNGFMIVWHTISLTTGAWFMSLFGLIHTAVGIGLAYGTLAGFMNTTEIKVGRGNLTLRHGPIPWKGNKDIASHSVRQLYCKEKISHGKNGPHSRYTVEIVLDSDKRETLVKNLNEAEQALFIEQQIEGHLGIQDQATPGEISR
ncbi:MAG: hypothetical protein ACI9R3_001906 [Verrucomicrobiales bacterium]|jgi:hypothetical protein